MSNLLAVPILLVLSVAMGALIGLQWFPQKDGGPPRKPLPERVAVALAVLFGAIFVTIVVLAVIG
ncbi:MAG: hypothetical protein LBE35_00010 [Clostridiales bacterium]|jgi:hypothetical protein|nr:hypothetical protein [Clostridiales bacterium]